MRTALTFSSHNQTRYQQKKLFIIQKVPDATLYNKVKLQLTTIQNSRKSNLKE